MRFRSYSVFEIVAGPAAVWCAIEITLRAALAAPDGIPATAFTGALAALTVTACRIRSRQLSTVPAVK